MPTDNTRQIYVVISQTGTFLSRILKRITGAQYNHASLSLSPTLQNMYSFGRMNPYNPFWGGFVTESPNFGTFKRFSNTRVIVLALDISEENYENMRLYLEQMVSDKHKYGYNYLGLYLAALHIIYTRQNRYYCSEFVREILKKYKIDGADGLSPIVHPIHFLTLPHKTVFTGKLSEYSYQNTEKVIPM